MGKTYDPADWETALAPATELFPRSSFSCTTAPDGRTVSFNRKTVMPSRISFQRMQEMLGNESGNHV